MEPVWIGALVLYFVIGIIASAILYRIDRRDPVRDMDIDAVIFAGWLIWPIWVAVAALIAWDTKGK